MIEIDWERLSTRLGLLHEHGESGSSDAAKRALELIIGEDACRAAVDYYIAGRRGHELSRMVLWQLHPWSAMEYCYEIFNSARPIEDRRSAVELLRVVADGRALPWVAEFLSDTDNELQGWGAGVLDQLLWSNLIAREEAEELLIAAEQHDNNAVRTRAEFIRGFLRSRIEQEIQPSTSKKATASTSTGRRVRVGNMVRVTRVPPGCSELSRDSQRCFRRMVGRRFRIAAIARHEPRWIGLNVVGVARSLRRTVWLEPRCIE
jgi:hypothetical protein